MHDNYKIGSKDISILYSESCTKSINNDGKCVWWFGSCKENKIPTSHQLISLIKSNSLSTLPPPWAAIIKGADNEGLWICTDIIGLQHLYYYQDQNRIIISDSSIEIGKTIGNTKIDAIALFELMCRGNPQKGRSILKKIDMVANATTIHISGDITINQYWKYPEPEICGAAESIDVFAKNVRESIRNQYHDDDVQELTAGRDSLMLLSAYLAEGIKIKTWTHGFKNSPDLIGAKERAKIYNVDHQTVALEPLLEIDAEKALEYLMKFISATSGNANALEYWHLPWILERVDGNGSISGMGGEVFRGFYYEWIGKGKIPLFIGKELMLRGKIREHMPFTSKVVRSDLAKIGSAIIRKDVWESLRQEKCIWDSLDRYYLMNRMQYFAGTTFSGVSRWKKVRLPLFSTNVIACLHKIPYESRGWSAGITHSVTEMYFRSIKKTIMTPPSYETKNYRIAKLIGRFKQLEGTFFFANEETLIRKILKTETIKNLLEYKTLKIGPILNKNQYNIMKDRVYSGGRIPIYLGAIITAELIAHELGSDYAGIEI